MIDIDALERTLDLWASRWEPRERVAFEEALVRALKSDAHGTRLQALCACRAIGTPRLETQRLHAAWRFTREEQQWAEASTAELHALLQLAEHMRGEPEVVRFFLHNASNSFAAQLLDRIDLRDLMVAARSVDDAALRREVARRIARRGRHQRARLAERLGVVEETLPRLALGEPLPEDGYYDDYSIADLAASSA
jgi:hypothetical protein